MPLTEKLIKEILPAYLESFSKYHLKNETGSTPAGTRFLNSLRSAYTTNKYVVNDPTKTKLQECDNYIRSFSKASSILEWMQIILDLGRDAKLSKEAEIWNESIYSITLHATRTRIIAEIRSDAELCGEFDAECKKLTDKIDVIKKRETYARYIRGKASNPEKKKEMDELTLRLANLGHLRSIDKGYKNSLLGDLTNTQKIYTPVPLYDDEKSSDIEPVNINFPVEYQQDFYKWYPHYLEAKKYPQQTAIGDIIKKYTDDDLLAIAGRPTSLDISETKGSVSLPISTPEVKTSTPAAVLKVLSEKSSAPATIESKKEVKETKDEKNNGSILLSAKALIEKEKQKNKAKKEKQKEKTKIAKQAIAGTSPSA